MSNKHGGKRKGASRPKLDFKTKVVSQRIFASDYKNFAKENESYDDFFQRCETAMLEAMRSVFKGIA
jgi:enamine deaminase RidA (YjgF/YER057c/UK114 family)